MKSPINCNLLNQLKNNLVKLNDDEESLLNLTKYNDLTDKYNEYLENLNNSNDNNNDSLEEPTPNNTLTIVLIITGSIVVLGGASFGAFMYFRKRRNGGAK